jgi:hypothetical protein
MSEKQELIEAFKKLDFEALDILLDDDTSYMDVPKKLFLKRLSKEIIKYDKLNTYESVKEGICGFCNKGCKAYKFSAKDCPSLNLFFEENNGKVTDIYICNDLNVESSDENEWDIYLNFYEEEKVDFKPSLQYNINIQKVEVCIEEYNALVVNGFVTSQDLVYWYNKYKTLISELDLVDPFLRQPYKAFEKLDNTYTNVYALVHNFNQNSLAIEALEEYQNINKHNERSNVKWLLKYKNEKSYSLEKTDNWKKTGFIILRNNPTIIIDCSNCLGSFLFEDLYSNLKDSLLKKYEPTEQQYRQNEGSVNYNLETFLKLHKKYLDLLINE